MFNAKKQNKMNKLSIKRLTCLITFLAFFFANNAIFVQAQEVEGWHLYDNSGNSLNLYSWEAAKGYYIEGDKKFYFTWETTGGPNSKEITLTQNEWGIDTSSKNNSNFTSYSGSLEIPASLPNPCSEGGPEYIVTKIAPRAFDHCSGITEVILPNTITKIGYGAFSECTNLVSIHEKDSADGVLPNSLDTLGGRVFWNNKIKTITLPPNVKRLDDRCFFGCKNLKSLTITGRIEYIGANLCYNCSELTNVYVKSFAPPTLDITDAEQNHNDFKYHFPQTATIHVPCIAKDAYKNAPNWTYNHKFSDQEGCSGSGAGCGVIEGDNNLLSVDEIKFLFLDIHSHVHITNTNNSGDCDLSALANFQTAVDEIDEITIHDGGSLSFDDYQGAASGFGSKIINIERVLPVGAWSLIGNINAMSNEFPDNDNTLSTYAFLNNNKADWTDSTLEFAALPFDYNTNAWATEYAMANQSTPETFGAILVWPMSYFYNGDGLSIDTYDTLTQRMIGSQINGGRGDITFQGNSVGGDAYWFALSNPFLGRLNLKNFYTTNTSTIQGTTAYVWKTGDPHSGENNDASDDSDWKEVSLEDSNVVLLPTTGFMIAGTSATSSFTLNKSQITNVDVATENTYKSSEENTKMEFSANAVGVEKKSYAKQEEYADNRFDFRDSPIMFPENTESVSPYFTVDGHPLIDNRFASMPYAVDLNFHAYKDKIIDFALTKACQNIEVTLINLANETETILTENEPVVLNVTQGENANQYQLRFSKKNVGINEVVSEENSISIWTDGKHVNINGKELQRVEIYNLLGQKVYSSKLAGNNTVLNPGLNNGVYVIKAFDNKNSKSEKVILR